MPANLWPIYRELHRQADVVKLVGQAQRPTEMAPIFDLLSRATGPIIALAMGQAGQLTRLLASCSPHCLLTYGAAAASAPTASGQLSVDDLVQRYHLERVGPQTLPHVHLCASSASAEAIIAQNITAASGEPPSVPLLISPEEAAVLLPRLKACLPHLTFTADPGLQQAL